VIPATNSADSRTAGAGTRQTSALATEPEHPTADSIVIVCQGAQTPRPGRRVVEGPLDALAVAGWGWLASASWAPAARSCIRTIARLFGTVLGFLMRLPLSRREACSRAELSRL